MGLGVTPGKDMKQVNMKEYEENIKEYDVKCGKYEGIPLLCRPWDLEKFRDLPLYIGFGTWRNSELSSFLYRLIERQDSKDMKHDFYFLVRLINCRKIER